MTRTTARRCKRLDAHDRLGDKGCLVVGVLDRLQADSRPVGKAVGVGGAVADGKDVGQAGATRAIDQHAVAALSPCGEQRLDGGDDPDADDHHLGRENFSVD